MSQAHLAADLAARSQFYVFPCREVEGPNGEPIKSPYIADQHRNASRNLEDIAAWWKKWPDALVGVSTGLSDLVVVDIDVKNGKNGYERLGERNLELPDTFSYNTPSGGRHMLYRSPAAKKLKQAGNYLDMPGVDRQTGKSHICFYAPNVPDPAFHDAAIGDQPGDIAAAPAWLMDTSSGSESYDDAVPFKGDLNGAIWTDPAGETSWKVSEVIQAIHDAGHIGNEELKKLSLRVAFTGVEGHPGWTSGWTVLKERYYATSNGTESQKDAEWDRLMRGAIGIAEAAKNAGKTIAYVDYPSLFPPKPAVKTTAEAMAQDTDIKLLTIDDLHHLPTYGWWVEDMIREASLAIIGGHGGLGKTVLTLMMCLCIATGADFLGRPVKKGNVLYVAAEGIEDFAARIDAAAEHHGLDLAAAEQNIRFVETGVNLSVAASVDKLKEVLKEGHFDVIVLDTMSQLAAMNSENDNSEAADIMRIALSLRRITPGSAVLFVHHTNRTSGTLRGASAFRDNVDTVIAMDGSSENFLLSTDYSHMGKQRSRAPFTEKGFAIVDHHGVPVLDHHRARAEVSDEPATDDQLSLMMKAFEDGRVHTLQEVADLGDFHVRAVQRATKGYRQLGELKEEKDESGKKLGYRWIRAEGTKK